MIDKIENMIRASKAKFKLWFVNLHNIILEW